MTHALKTWPEYYNLLQKGDKTFELRKDDRPFEIGDSLILQEYELISGYTGSELNFQITGILRDAGNFGLRKGFCILSIRAKGNDDY